MYGLTACDNLFQLKPFIVDRHLFINEMDTCIYMKVTNRPKGPGAIYNCIVLFVLLVKYAHVTIIKYLLTYLLIIIIPPVFPYSFF